MLCLSLNLRLNEYNKTEEERLIYLHTTSGISLHSNSILVSEPVSKAKVLRCHGLGGVARWWKSRVPKSPAPPNYQDNLQIILKIYEFGLRFKERTAGMLQWEEFMLHQGRKTGKKERNKRHPRGRDPPGAGLRPGECPLDRKAPSWRSRSCTNLPGRKGTRRELERDPRRGGYALRLPGTLIDTCAPGRVSRAP